MEAYWSTSTCIFILHYISEFHKFKGSLLFPLFLYYSIPYYSHWAMILLIKFSPSSDDPYISCPEIGTPFTLSSFSVSMVPSHRKKKVSIFIISVEMVSFLLKTTLQQ